VLRGRRDDARPFRTVHSRRNELELGEHE
jgi:hypothetical protein